MPWIWPPSSATGIADHSGHPPIMTADPTVKPAKPFLLAQVTFSTGKTIQRPDYTPTFPPKWARLSR